MKHGDRVTVASRLWRGERYEDVNGINKPVMAWRKRTGKQKEPESGVFLGWRTVQRGCTQWMGDDGNYFKIYGYDKVALVSMGPHENPVYIHPDEMEKSGDEN